MKLPTIILCITAIYLIGFFSHALYLQKTVYGDGIFYFSWLRSLVVDHDIHFADEYRHFGAIQPMTARREFGNKYSIGPALVWWPLYTTAFLFLRGDGWSLPYQLAVGLTSVLAAIFGLIVLLRIIKQPPGVLGITVLLIAGATNLLFYGSVDAVNSHALSFFAAAVYIALLSAPSVEWFAAGLFLGLLTAIRIQDAVFVLLVLPYWRKLPKRMFLAGFGLAMLPQLLAWYALYGTLANPYLAGGERFDVLHPHILGVLFSPENGLFVWTPVVAIGVIGLFLRWRVYWPYLAVFFSELYIVACWGTWWQGASVSGRMFVSSLPIIAIGLSVVVGRIYRIRLIQSQLLLLSGTLCCINALSIIYYLLIH